MQRPLVSIIIPVYQVENYLRRCLESVLIQNYNNYEIILVNDGSTDSSPAICDEYASVYEFISVIHKENGGLSDARNVGLQYAKGQYVIFLDSDDWFLPGVFEEFKEVIAEGKYDVIQMGRQMYYSEKDTRENRGRQKEVFSGVESLSNMLSNGYVTSFATDKFFKKDLFTNNPIRFPVAAYYEDLGTIYKLLLASKSVYVNNQVYYAYYLGNENSITKSWTSKKFQDIFQYHTEIAQAAEKYSMIDKQLIRAFYSNGLVYILMKLYENRESHQLINQVLEKLEANKVPLTRMKGYYHFSKYFLYRIGLLKFAVTIKQLLKK